MTPLLLVISGLPAAGKSHLGARVAAERRWPYVTKDGYKAILHARLPDITHAQSGPTSFELMWHVAGVTLAAGVSTVLETHFYRGISEPRIEALAKDHGAHVRQVYCEAPLDVLRDRHAARVASGARPHIDRPLEIANLPDSACWTPLALNAPLLRVDTSAGDPLPGVLAWLQALGVSSTPSVSAG